MTMSESQMFEWILQFLDYRKKPRSVELFSAYIAHFNIHVEWEKQHGTKL